MKRKTISDEQLIGAMNKIDSTADADFEDRLINTMITRYGKTAPEPAHTFLEQMLGRVIIFLLVSLNLILLFSVSATQSSIILCVPLLTFVGLFWGLILVQIRTKTSIH